jgi:MFS family permease
VITPPRTAVRRLALARAISLTGSAAAYTALMFTVYDRTESAAWLSASLFVTEGASGLLGPIASVLGDRFDRRRVMIWSDLGAAACFGAMAFVDSPGPLVAVAFLSAVAESPFWPASSAAIPNLVPPDEVSWANSLVAVGRNLGITVGPALGGVLLAAIGPSWVFGSNAVSFVVSAALIASVHAAFSQARTEEHASGGVRAGLTYLVREPVLGRLTVAWIAFILAIGLAMVADVPFVELFDAGSVGFGMMIGSWGAGSILGSLAGRRLRESTEVRWLVISTAAVGALTIAIAASPWFALVIALGLALGFVDGVAVVADQNIYQRRTPDAIRSRVMGAFEGAIHGTLAISYLVAAVVVPVVGPRGAYVIGGVGGLTAAVVMLPLIRRAREHPVVPDAVGEAEAPEPVAAEVSPASSPVVLPPASGV